MVCRHNAERTHSPQRADGELLGGFALGVCSASTCVRWDGAAGLAGWLRWKGVMWLGPSGIAAGFCPRRLLCRGCGVLRAVERLTGLSGEAAGCLCPRTAIHSSATGTAMPCSAARLSTSLLTSFRKKFINLPAIRPEANIAIICSIPCRIKRGLHQSGPFRKKMCRS